MDPLTSGIQMTSSSSQSQTNSILPSGTLQGREVTPKSATSTSTIDKILKAFDKFTNSLRVAIGIPIIRHSQSRLSEELLKGIRNSTSAEDFNAVCNSIDAGVKIKGLTLDDVIKVAGCPEALNLLINDKFVDAIKSLLNEMSHASTMNNTAIVRDPEHQKGRDKLNKLFQAVTKNPELTPEELPIIKDLINNTKYILH